MDVFALLVCVVSVFLAGYLARERGRSQHRWAMTAAMIGPFAIPLIYLTDAGAALSKWVNSRKA